MRVSDFHFDLPDELIARYPKEDRSSCRLLQLNGENGGNFSPHFYRCIGFNQRRRFVDFQQYACDPLLVCLVEKPVAGKLKCWWNVF